jgi:uncharacterized protein (UPF0335 family)
VNAGRESFPCRFLNNQKEKFMAKKKGAIGDNVVDVEKLKNIISRLEVLDNEDELIKSEMRDVFNEAKGNGYDVKAIRRLRKLLAMEESERLEMSMTVGTYASAMGVELDPYS